MKKILVVTGPTGSGKTSLSIELAKRYNGEIISGDAYQIYKKMDIGTAKITEDEMDGIRHYFVDELNNDEDYNVKIFQSRGRAIIDDILSRNKTVIICGGTGMYIKALLYDYKFSDEKKDEAYQKYLDSLTEEELYELILKTDPEVLETIHIHNHKRIKRALMMAHLGKKKTDLLKEQQHIMLYDAYLIGLTAERELIYERINKRVDLMFEMGLEEEVKSLVKTKDDFKLQSMRAIGYKEFESYLYGEMSLEEVKELIKKNTRNFAKRQYTYFNNQLDICWYDICSDYKDELIKTIDQFD